MKHDKSGLVPKKHLNSILSDDEEISFHKVFTLRRELSKDNNADSGLTEINHHIVPRISNSEKFPCFQYFLDISMTKLFETWIVVSKILKEMSLRYVLEYVFSDRLFSFLSMRLQSFWNDLPYFKCIKVIKNLFHSWSYFEIIIIVNLSMWYRIIILHLRFCRIFIFFSLIRLPSWLSNKSKLFLSKVSRFAQLFISQAFISDWLFLLWQQASQELQLLHQVFLSRSHFMSTKSKCWHNPTMNNIFALIPRLSNSTNKRYPFYRCICSNILSYDSILLVLEDYPFFHREQEPLYSILQLILAFQESEKYNQGKN